MPENFDLLRAEISHIKEKVDDIDKELKAMRLGSRIAVLEDRQTILFRLIHGIIGFISTVVVGIVVWVVTR